MAKIHKSEKEQLINYIYLFSSIIAFIIIAFLVADGKTNNFDDRILLGLRSPLNRGVPVGPSWLMDNFRDVTALGSTVVVIIISVITSAYLIIEKKYLLARLFLFSVIGGGVSDLILKEIFARPRPVVVSHFIEVTTWSFPSGHAVMSVVVYFTLAYISTQGLKNKALKNYINNAALIIAIIIGFSRVYLGVHNPTDVFAGWALGIALVSVSEIIFNGNVN